MRKHRERIFPGAFGAALCAGTLLLLATATPAAAASNDEVKGWLVALDVALTQPGGLDQEYAFESDIAANPHTGTRHTLDYGNDATFKLTAGYDFGLDLGRLEVSYWGFDQNDSASDVMSGYVFPSLFGYGIANFGTAYLYDPAGGVRTRADSNVQATTLDIDYSRAMDVGSKFTFRWLAGLRTATFEEEVKFSGTAAGYYGYDYNIKQRRHMDSTARGFRVGGRGTFGFTKRFSMDGGLALSLLRADIKGDSSQTVTGAGSESDRHRGEDKSGQGQILDLDVRGIWTEGSWSIYLGYSASSWEGLVRDPNPPRTPYWPTGAGGGRDSITFTSFNVGVIYRFNPRRLSAP